MWLACSDMFWGLSFIWMMYTRRDLFSPTSCNKLNLNQIKINKCVFPLVWNKNSIKINIKCFLLAFEMFVHISQTIIINKKVFLLAVETSRWHLRGVQMDEINEVERRLSEAQTQHGQREAGSQSSQSPAIIFWKTD